MLNRYARIVLMAAALALMAVPARALAHDHGFGDDDDFRFSPRFARHDRGLHLGWYKHHRHGRHYFQTDCDEDDDDCRPLLRRFPPFAVQPLSFRGLSGASESGLLAERANLVYALNSAQAQYVAALQRGDRRGAKHYLHAVQKLQAQVAGLDSRIGAFPGHNPAYYATPAIPGALGAGVYPLDPTTAAVSALIPLLQIVHP